MADDGVELRQQCDAEMPAAAAREAFVSPEHAGDGSRTVGHVYDGYELLLDIDDSVLDDYLPAPAG